MKKNKPLVSIIIPCWGSYKQYLKQCLDSIDNQSFKDYEVIVVSNKKDLPSARNEGIKKAKGKYILPLDVDDNLHQEYLARVIGKIKETKADIITTACNQNGKKYLPALEVSLEKMTETNIVIACSLFKKEIWNKIGGYDETMKTGLEDWDFWLRAMMKGYKVEVLDEILYNYNKRPDGQISTMLDKDTAIEHLRSKHIKYSVIIPTMWASDKIKEMIKVYDKCDYISEVLIINNKPEDSLKLKSKKVKEIYKGENIYVNPAWNLGVKEAKEEHIIIANDDIYFKNLTELLNRITLRDNMIVGPALSSFKEINDNGKITPIEQYTGQIKIEPTDKMTWGYGTFMIMKKSAYQVVPSHLLIWEGDIPQFQANDSYVFKGINIDTEMSETIKKFDLKKVAKRDVLNNKNRLPKIKVKQFTENDIDITKEITFIIKTFKRYECLDNLLRSIKRFYPTAKVLIADDNHKYEYDCRLYLKWKKRLDLEVIRLPFDSGLSAGRNAMVDKAKNPFILLLDDDFVFTEQTDINKFYKILKSDKEIGIVGGSCIEGDKEVHYECNLDFNNGVLKQISDGDKWKLVDGVKAKKTQCVLNFFLARKRCLKENAWDNNLKLGEHTDFFLRLSRTNWQVYYTPEVKIVHDKNRNIGDYAEFRNRGFDYTIDMFKKNKIQKMISITGAVKELQQNGMKKYKIFNK